MPRPASLRSALAGAVTMSAVALLLAGCVSSPADPSGDASPAPTSTPTSTASAAPTAPAEPTFDADGTAEQNLPIFTAVTAQVWASPEQMSGRAYIDALTAVGFDKASMQVTNDLTSLSKPVDTLMYSVHWGDECLIGQVGPETGDPVTIVAPALDGGGCLIGVTRNIDW